MLTIWFGEAVLYEHIINIVYGRREVRDFLNAANCFFKEKNYLIDKQKDRR